MKYLALGFAILVSGCTLEPRYEKPAVAPIESYREAGAWQPAQPADADPRGPWWEVFGDPQLDALEQQLGASSQDLRAAIARYEIARSAADQARGALWPVLQAGGAATRGQGSSNAPGASPPMQAGNDYVASLSLSWEIDLFGRLRSAARAQARELEASAGDLAAFQLSLQAELARSYFELRGADATLVLLEDSVGVFERAADLTSRRYAGGIAAATDVDQAESQLQTAKAQAAAVRLQRARLEHAIAVLVGKAPAEFSLPPAPFAATPPPIDAGLPSTILERRPDVAAAERRVAAANAQIGVARAAWFPVFGLGATGGYEATSSADWFDAPSRYWAVGPGVSMPIFDARLPALNRGARAAYDEAVAQYRQAVLVAYQEVEDQLAALRHLADEQAGNQAAATAAERSVFHANRRYAAGVASYLEVTVTQNQALSAQRAALDAGVRRVVASVRLVQALGGGWTPGQLAAPLVGAR